MDVRLPDGTIISNVPDGTTKADLIGRLQNNGYDVSRLIEQTAAEQTTSSMSGPQRFFAGAGKAMTDIARGAGQILGISDQAAIEEARRRDAPLMKTGAGLAGNITGGMAAAAPAMLIPGANTLIGSSAVGGALGAIQPTVEGESRGMNAVTGGAGGALGYGAGRLLSRVISPTDTAITQTQARVLGKSKDIGMETTPGTATGSVGLRQMESAAESFPFTSGPFAAIRSGNQTVINRSAAKAIGESSDTISDDVLSAARSRIGAVFNETEKIPQIPIDNQLASKMAGIEMKYRGLLHDKPLAQYPVVKEIYDSLGGTITGKQYNDWQSQLGKIAKSQFQGDSKKPNVGFALYEVKNALDDAASAMMTGAEKEAFNTAKQQWRNLVMLESTGAVNEQTGNVSGKILANVLSRKDKSGFRLGGNTSEMYDAARFYKAFPGIVGDSGTASRVSLPWLLGSSAGSGALGALAGHQADRPGMGAAAGALAPLLMGIGARGAAGMYLSPLSQAYLTNQAINPAMRGVLAEIGALGGANAALAGRGQLGILNQE